MTVQEPKSLAALRRSKLMSGNEAIALGAWEAGVHVACGYPGTLSTEISEHDVFDATGGYAERVIALFGRSTKPFAVVIDAGRYHDALADHLQASGVPTFRSADRATLLLGLYAEHRLRGAVDA